MESENNNKNVYDHNGTLVVILASENNDNRYTLYDYRKISRRIKRSFKSNIAMSLEKFDRKYLIRSDFNRLDTLESISTTPLTITRSGDTIRAGIKGRNLNVIDIIIDVVIDIIMFK